MMETTHQDRSIVLGQQYVIQARREASENGLAPLGTRGEIAERLAPFNTSSDGVDPNVLHGPGIRIDLGHPADEREQVNQMLLSVNEEEIGFLVIQRLAKEFRWTILDMNTGREWNP